MRPTEQIRIDCAEKFFEQLQKDGFDVKYRTQINNDDMKKIVAELIKQQPYKKMYLSTLNLSI